MIFRIRENKISIYFNFSPELKNSVMLDYLKKSAEEGYVHAQYELGNEYIKGELCKTDYYKALIWHRQSCRNGNILSYEPCGDILKNGSENVKQNKILSLVMYYTGYSKGLFDLKPKVLNLKDELMKENENLPEMILI